MLTRPMTEALLFALTAPPSGSATWVEVLRLAQAALTDEAMAVVDGAGTSPAAELAVRTALQACDPRPQEASAAYPQVLQRLRTEIDEELSRWVSATTQPLGPSGEVALPE
jgi:hypothetical protein